MHLTDAVPVLAGAPSVVQEEGAVSTPHLRKKRAGSELIPAGRLGRMTLRAETGRAGAGAGRTRAVMSCSQFTSWSRPGRVSIKSWSRSGPGRAGPGGCKDLPSESAETVIRSAYPGGPAGPDDSAGRNGPSRCRCFAARPSESSSSESESGAGRTRAADPSRAVTRMMVDGIRAGPGRA
jgi:hypothetical protein